MEINVTLRQTLLTSVAAGALALVATIGLSEEANAEAYALSIVEITDLDVSLSNGQGLFSTTTADLLFESQATTGLNGIISGTSDGPRKIIFPPGAIVDPLLSSKGLGAPNLTENSYVEIGDPSVGGSVGPNFSRADNILTDVRINPPDAADLGAGAGIGQGTFSAHAESRTLGQKGTGNNTISQLWTFAAGVVDVGETLTISGNAFVHLIAELLNASEQGSAEASYTLTAGFGDNAGVAFLAEDLSVNGTDLLKVTTSPDKKEAKTVGFEAFSFDILVGAGDFETNGTLDFNVSFSSAVTANSIVPEPGALGVLAIGLLGLGAAARRRHPLAS
jgi:hypothetical protein